MRISDWSSDVCSSDLDPTSVAHHCSGAGGLSMNDRRIRGLRWVVLTRLVLAIAGLTMVTGSCMSQNEQYAPGDAGLSFPAASDTPQTETALSVDYSAFLDHKPDIANAADRPAVEHAAQTHRI